MKIALKEWRRGYYDKVDDYTAKRYTWEPGTPS